MSDKRTSRYRAIIVAIAPATLAVTLVAHPYLPGRLPNARGIADAVAADTTFWGLVHLATALASGLMILAFLAIHGHLRDAGANRWSGVGVPFVVIGSTLFAMLPGMEFAPLAAADTGADVAAVQAALQGWFTPVLAIGGLTFAAGVFAFMRDIAATGIPSPRWAAVVAGALAVMALSRLVPLSAAQFYVQSAAAILALWPLAYHMWRHPTALMAAAPRHAQTVRS